MANYLGVAANQDAHELFKNNQGIKDDVKYPSLSSGTTKKEDIQL